MAFAYYLHDVQIININLWTYRNQANFWVFTASDKCSRSKYVKFSVLLGVCNRVLIFRF